MLIIKGKASAFVRWPKDFVGGSDLAHGPPFAHHSCVCCVYRCVDVPLWRRLAAVFSTAGWTSIIASLNSSSRPLTDQSDGRVTPLTLASFTHSASNAGIIYTHIKDEGGSKGAHPGLHVHSPSVTVRTELKWSSESIVDYFDLTHLRKRYLASLRLAHGTVLLGRHAGQKATENHTDTHE